MRSEASVEGSLLTPLACLSRNLQPPYKGLHLKASTWSSNPVFLSILCAPHRAHPCESSLLLVPHPLRTLGPSPSNSLPLASLFHYITKLLTHCSSLPTAPHATHSGTSPTAPQSKSPVVSTICQDPSLSFLSNHQPILGCAILQDLEIILLVENSHFIS